MLMQMDDMGMELMCDEILNETSFAFDAEEDKTKNVNRSVKLTVDALMLYNYQLHEKFDSIQVGDVVATVPILGSFNSCDETSKENKARRNLARKGATTKFFEDNLRTARVVAKTQYFIVVEYVPMKGVFGMSKPWCESFSWQDVNDVMIITGRK